MGNIVLLDELTINKIAAGEVIERPASVVKELVENSIDAGATSITVEVQNGGISNIRITDNGKGIEKDDLEIAFERHATSKIREADDIETVKSMGFRGEALASIAAIANVEMISKTVDSDIGNRIVVEGGRVLEKGEYGCARGTTIIVKNLFYNTPVRYKFLKKDFTELGYIEDTIVRLALINTNIAFKLISLGKTMIQTNGDGNIQNVLYNIYGKDIATGVLDIDYEYEDIKVTGVVGKPGIARSNRANQLFFVNKRYVKDKTLSSAVEQAFKGLLPLGKFGFVVINLEMNPKKLDVNVHPTKLEVRFEEENKVFKAVYHAIKESLLKGNIIENNPFAPQGLKENNTQIKIQRIIDSINNNQIPNDKLQDNNEKFNNSFKDEVKENTKTMPLINVKSDKTAIQETPKEEKNIIGEIYTEKQKELTTPSEEQVALATERLALQAKPEILNNADYKDIDSTKNIKSNDAQKEISDDTETKLSFDEMYTKMFGKKIEAPKENDEIKTEYVKTTNMSVFEENEEYEPLNYKVIGIAFLTYIIIQIKDEIYIIDQHAAHERVLYEKIKKNFYDNKDKESQLMLVPDVITLTHKEMAIAEDSKEIFEKAGFTFESFGENTIKLTGVPSICMEMNTKELFLDILDEIDTVARTARQEIEDRFIATIACKAAVKANMKLTLEEVDELMKKLLKMPNPFTCPHGRPTAIKMSKTEIERKFSRR